MDTIHIVAVVALTASDISGTYQKQACIIRTRTHVPVPLDSLGLLPKGIPRAFYSAPLRAKRDAVRLSYKYRSQ